MNDTDRLNWLEKQKWFRQAIDSNLQWNVGDTVRQCMDNEIERTDKSICQTAEELVKRLRNGTRDVYRTGQSKQIYVTHGGGRVSESAVKEALQLGLIRNKWTDTADYWELSEAERT